MRRLSLLETPYLFFVSELCLVTVCIARDSQPAKSQLASKFFVSLRQIIRIKDPEVFVYLATAWSFTPGAQEILRIVFTFLAYLTCCAGEAAVHSAASSAGIQNYGGTSQPVCPVGS